jgi:heat shock protein HslJ
MRYAIRLYIIGLVITVGLLAACTPTGTEPIPTGRPILTATVANTPILTPTATNTAEASTGQLLSRLAGTTWDLVSWGPADNPIMPLSDRFIIATFYGQARVWFSLGCNSTGADLVVTGDALRLDYTCCESTELLCEEAGVMEQEDRLKTALGASEAILLEGDMLVISYGWGELRFRERFRLGVHVFRLTGIEIDSVLHRPLSSTVVVLAFTDDGQITGFAGCNDYSGVYAIGQESITFQEITTDGQTCNDAKIGNQEAVYLDGLGTADHYEWTGGILTLYFPNGSFILARMPYLEVRLWERSPWQLVSFGIGLAARPSLADTQVTLSFVGTRSGQLQVQGSAGCNEYNGDYEVRGTTLEVQELSVTNRGCADEIMNQEQQFLAALQSARHVALDGRLLLVYDQGVLVFEPVVGE